MTALCTHTIFNCSAGMDCGEEGMTKFLIQKVPYFRELVIASFYCDHCGCSNNDVTFGGEIQVTEGALDIVCICFHSHLCCGVGSGMHL